MKKDCILVLDIDGTLTDSVPMHQDALLGAMQALGLARLNTDWGSYPHHTDTGIFAHAMAENGVETLSSDKAASFERDLDARFATLLAERGLREVPGARALVLAAAQTRWGVVFATGASDRSVNASSVPSGSTLPKRRFSRRPSMPRVETWSRLR